MPKPPENDGLSELRRRAQADLPVEVIQRLRALLGHGEVQRRAVDLNEIAREALQLLNRELIGRGVRAELDLCSALASVPADRVQLLQVLMNLVLNACDAMDDAPAGARRLLVRTAMGEAEDVLIAVIDSGVGVPAETRERIFEPFHTTKAEGMGMGLSVSRSIIEAHSGRIRSVNSPGGGATFHVLLPASKCAPGGGRPRP